MDNSKARCSAFDKAASLLAFRARTTQEIKQKLNDKGYSSDEIGDAIEKLSYYGYLNDQNYALSYIKDNTSKKGKKLIINELSQKGIDKSIINDVYDEVQVDEITTIEEIVKRRYGSVDLNNNKTFKRVVGYFLRRGFNYNSVKCVLKNYINYDDIEIC